MAIRTITKNLAGKEDLFLGVGSEVQQRAGTECEITKINTTHLNGAITTETITDLLSLDVSKLASEAKVYMLGFHEINDEGQGLFYYDVNEPKSNHNGGTIIDNTHNFPDDWNDATQQASWFTPINTNLYGCFKRIYSDIINSNWFGLTTFNNNVNVNLTAKLVMENNKITANQVALLMPNLPTSDPTITGQLWVDTANSYVIKVSQG